MSAPHTMDIDGVSPYYSQKDMAANWEKINTFRTQKERLAGMMAETSAICRGLGMDVASKHLDEQRSLMLNRPFRILTVSCRGNGGAAVINVLLGDDFLPTSPLPRLTHTTEVKFGEKREVVLHFPALLTDDISIDKLPTKLSSHLKQHGKKDVPPLHIDFDELRDIIFFPFTGKCTWTHYLKLYDKWEIFGPYNSLKDGLEIIHTPELPDICNHIRKVTEYLTTADVILFILSADCICSREEIDFIEDCLYDNGYTNILFVVDRFNLIPEGQKEGVQKFVRRKLDRFFYDKEIFYVSAIQALDGIANGNEALYELSGMGNFTKYLENYLVEKGKYMLSPFIRELKHIINDEALNKVIPMQERMLNSTLEEVRGHYEIGKPQLEKLRNEREQIVAKLMHRIEQSEREFRLAIYNNMLAVVDMIPQWINDYIPQQRIGVIPTKARISNVVDEISKFVNQKIAKQQREWKKNVMRLLVREEVRFVYEHIDRDIEKIYDEIDALTIHLSGVVSQKVAACQRIDGLPTELDLVERILMNLDTETTLAFAVPPANAIVFLVAVLKAANAISELKMQLAAKHVETIRYNSVKIGNEILETMANHLTSVVTSVSNAIDNEIEQMDSQLRGLIAEMGKGQDSIDTRKQAIMSFEKRLKALNIEVDD